MKSETESDIIERILDNLSISRCYQLAEQKIREEIESQFRDIIAERRRLIALVNSDNDERIYHDEHPSRAIAKASEIRLHEIEQIEKELTKRHLSTFAEGKSDIIADKQNPLDVAHSCDSESNRRSMNKNRTFS